MYALSRQISEQTADLGADALIGAADGSFAAEQAARRGALVPAGESAAFLGDLPIDTVDDADLVDLLSRLGIRTLGAFAALPARDVLARFGPTGTWIHRQCGGRDSRPIAVRRPAPEHSVDITFEPALDRIDTIAFSARAGVDRFVTGLLAHGLACTCLELVAQTENGEESVRRWRQAGVLSAVDVVDRIRWQLEGWLNGRDCTSAQPSAGVTRLRLVPVQAVPTGAHQQSLWASSAADDDRAHRGLARVQTLLGHGSVLTAVVDGGRSPAERTRLVPWGDDRTDDHGTQGGTLPRARQPWPGRLPGPAPSVLIEPPRPIQVLDAANRPVVVTDRGAVPAAPAQLRVGSGPAVPVTAWTGPWPVDDSWWLGSTSEPVRRRSRFQLVDVHGRAYLVSYATDLPDAPATLAGPPASDPRWLLEALYD